MAAMLALIGAAGLHAVVFGLALALSAGMALPVADAHHVIEASVLSRKASLKLAKGRGFGGLLFHDHNMPDQGLHVQRGYAPFGAVQQAVARRAALRGR